MLNKPIVDKTGFIEPENGVRHYRSEMTTMKIDMIKVYINATITLNLIKMV